MGSTHRFLNEPKFVCACLFLLVGQTLASIKSVEDVANTEANASVGNQIEAQTMSQIERTPASRDSSGGDIVIESFDDGLLSVSNAKNSNNRHHYEPPAVADQQPQQLQQQPPPQNQQVQQVSPNPSIPAPATPVSLQENSVPVNSKPEPRNHQEDSQIETVIIDHRPSGALEQSSTGNTQVTTATYAAASGATGADYAHQPGGQHNLQQQQQQQPPVGASQQPVGAQTSSTTSHQVQGNQQQMMSNQPISGWYQSAAQPQPQAQQQQFNQQPAGGNYGGSIMGQVQHPTSINSIINDQQNQGQLSNMAMAQPQVAASSQQSTTMSSSPSGGQAQVMSLNGQPMYLVNPGSQGAFGGRRISISNWLKGISSMLASIFNRREHGNPLMSGQASSTTGHWIQLGPNAPHWLTQAQSLIQQQQQQLIGAASTGRYPTYVQAPPTMINQQQQQQLPMSVSNVQPLTISSGQAQHQVMPAGYNPVVISASGGSPTSQNNLVADLQASSSSNNYVAVQHLPSQQQFSTHANGLVQYPAGTAGGSHSGAGSQSGGSIQSQSNQPQLVQASPAGRQVTPAANVEQQQQSRQSSSPISTGQLNSSNTNNNNNNNNGSGSQSTIAWSAAAPPPQSTSSNVATAQNQARISRSSTSSLASASQNLPLAHYSRYAISSE